MRPVWVVGWLFGVPHSGHLAGSLRKYHLRMGSSAAIRARSALTAAAVVRLPANSAQPTIAVSMSISEGLFSIVPPASFWHNCYIFALLIDEAVMPYPAALRKARLVLFRRWLRETGLSYRDVADLCGVDRSYVRKALTGERPLTNSFCWVLRYRLLCPIDKVEPHPIDLDDL